MYTYSVQGILYNEHVNFKVQLEKAKGALYVQYSVNNIKQSCKNPNGTCGTIYLNCTCLNYDRWDNKSRNDLLI